MAEWSTYKIGDISGNYKSYIGLPEIYDIFSITLGNEAQVPVNGVLKDSPDVFYMLNKNNYIIKYDSSSFKVGIIDIKPVIMLKDNVIITKGSGFENDPYYID